MYVSYCGRWFAIHPESNRPTSTLNKVLVSRLVFDFVGVFKFPVLLEVQTIIFPSGLPSA